MSIFTVTLIRHGETAYNRKKIIQGHIDTDLSEKGQNQATLCGQRLHMEKYSHVYSSDLKRAYQTCELILQQNKGTTCTIVKDKRLRERNFGSYENRPSEYFVKAAKDSRVPVAEYIPPHGESLKEVRTRAIEFFHSLCENIRHQAEKDSANENNAASIKRRRHTGSFCSTSGSEVFILGGDDSPTIEQPELHLLEEPHSFNQGHSNSGSTSSTSGYSSTGADGLESPLETSLSPSNLSPVSPAMSGTQNMGNSNYPWEDGNGPIFQPLFDRDIRLHIQPPLATHLGCPNVSLSPIFEHRLSSMSSISSGRNSSFDETDLVPATIADVLIVSHNGLLKQAIAYFVDELGCKVPGTQNQYMQNLHNAAISKFAVTLGERVEDPPKVTCLSWNDRDHLLDVEVRPLNRTEEK